MNYIIGAGGGGSLLAPVLCKLTGPENVTIIDGDTLEEKNLDRQLFEPSDIGSNKAVALGRRYGCKSITKWYHSMLLEHTVHDWLICCVDNHPGRAAVLAACDMNKCRAIIAANETLSSEAYVYQHGWRNTPLDPRVYYPELVNDHSNDPRAIAIGCTGEAQVNNRQLVTANFSAAALAMHLFVVWAMEARKLRKETIPHLPHRLSQTLTKSESFKTGEAGKEQKV